MNTSLTGIPEREQVSGTQVPPLENGDRLTRYEFERRYTANPQIKKAELIEGVVYVASPYVLNVMPTPMPESSPG